MDYGAILRRSFELTKKHKWLWVYGLVLAAFGGGGFNGGGGRGGSSSVTSPKSLPKDVPEHLPEKASEVLGKTTNAIASWLSHVPVTTWVLLGLGILLLFILLLVISSVMRSWATGALIAGVADADLGKDVSLASTTFQGISSIWPLIKLGIISLAVTLGTLIAAAALFGLGYLVFSFSDISKVIWAILAGLVIGLTALVLLALFSITNIYAERLIVLKGSSSLGAWKRGFRLTWRHFWQTVVMGFINSAVGCAVGCLSTLVLLVLLGVPTALLVVPLFQGGFHWPSISVLIALVLILFTFVYLSLAISAVLIVFRYGTWNLFFKEIMNNEQ